MMWRWTVLALVAANAGFWLWSHGELRTLGWGPIEVAEPNRLKNQIQADMLRLTPQEPAAAMKPEAVPDTSPATPASAPATSSAASPASSASAASAASPASSASAASPASPASLSPVRAPASAPVALPAQPAQRK